jgi:geranylgeranyl diphosphate synthase type I
MISERKIFSMIKDGSENRCPVSSLDDTAPVIVPQNPNSPDTAISETTHPKNSIEWWFVHGSFESARTGRRYFMASIFRYELPGAGLTDNEGYYVLASFLDPVTGRNEVISRGERDSINRVFAKEEDTCSTNLDSDLVTCYREELISYGPPPPLSLAEEKATMNPDPFSFSWGDIAFHQTQGAIHLVLTDPGTGCPCRFVLSPASPRHVMQGIGTSEGRSMSYITCPRMALSGTYEDERIRGTAWFDHQWGNTSWFLSQPKGGNVQGWDWVGINGDDGTDWIFLSFQDKKTETVLGMFAIEFKEGQQPRVFHHFSVKTTRFWESEKTRIRYPVAQEFEIPEISARISITPVTDDQEIPVLGFMRTIWEGAATASGEIDGHPFTGTARLELQGYGYIFDFQQYIQVHINRIQGCIESFFPGTLSDADFQKFVGSPHRVYDLPACNQTIVRPVWDLLSREKKYWRPVFGLLLLETLGVRSEKYKMLLSVGPELTHTGTLIIDDIEDDARVRRGDVCIHRRYGMDIAINAANTMYFLPSVLYSQHPDLSDKQRLGFYRIYMDSFIRGHFGQGQDIWWTRNLTVENITAWSHDHLREKILQMYDFKTASAALAIAEAGCILADATPDVRDACISFARELGVAFQITDDIQGFEQTPDTEGVCGEDLAAGKLTYVIVRAMELLETVDRDRLKKILCSKPLRQDPVVLNEGIGLVQKSGALSVCRHEAQSMVEAEWKNFSLVIPPSEPKTMLRLFCRNLINNSQKR